MFWLVLWVLAGAAFVLSSSAPLPAYVASNFGGGGQANSFMSRDAYLLFHLVMLLGMPLLLCLPVRLMSYMPVAWINLPHKAYWLAPERRAATQACLLRYMLWLSAAIVLLLCFVHALLVQANMQQPPRLAEGAFLVGLLLFGLFLLAWCMALFRHFRHAH